MKLIQSCGVCSQEFQKKYKEETGILIGSIPGYCCIEFNVTDEPRYDLTCNQGHQFTIIYNEEKYEILFTSGCHAFEAGYFREAVSSVAASIERFYEYLIKVMCRAHGLEVEDIESTWKLVKSQSERQIGSYIYLYLTSFKQKPTLIDQKKIEFRNDVIHKGYFPNEKQTYDYLNYILSYFHDTLQIFNSMYPKYTFEPYAIRDKEYRKEAEKSERVLCFAYSSKFQGGLMSTSTGRITLDQLLLNAKTERQLREKWEMKIDYYTF